MSQKAQSLANLSFVLVLVLLYKDVDSATYQTDEVSLRIKARLNKNVTVIEVFTTSAEQNYVLSQFHSNDGSISWLLYDFANGMKVFKMDVLGEPELGQKQYQSICFITTLKKDEIIPPEAMSKLRQKTTGTVQEANDFLKTEVISTDVELSNLESDVRLLRGKFRQMCLGQHSIVYAKESDLKSLSGGDQNILESLLKKANKYKSVSELPNCSSLDVSYKHHPCVCKIPFTTAWYPCTVKYCQRKNSSGNLITTRCGIRSCRKTFLLHFTTSHPLSCHNDIT